MISPITIIIVDDHSIVRQGVRTFLELQPDLSVIGEAASGDEAVKLVCEHAPHIVLMDLLMPGMSGIEAIRQVKSTHEQTQVVVLTSYYEDRHIFAALQAGASSYALKDIRPWELVDLVRRTALGESILHPRVAPRIIQEMRRLKRDVPPAFTELTERELDVLRLIAEGRSNAVIAEMLVLSENTVKGYVSSVLNKLQMADRTQAAVFAWQQGLIVREVL